MKKKQGNHTHKVATKTKRRESTEQTETEIGKNENWIEHRRKDKRDVKDWKQEESTLMSIILVRSIIATPLQECVYNFKLFHMDTGTFYVI